MAKEVGITRKQTFAKEGKQLTRKAGGYAHARQFRRLRKPITRQRTNLRGSDGDAIHEVLCAAGYNVRKKGVRLYFYLIRLLGSSGLFARKAPANSLNGPTSGRLSLLLT